MGGGVQHGTRDTSGDLTLVLIWGVNMGQGEEG